MTGYRDGAGFKPCGRLEPAGEIKIVTISLYELSVGVRQRAEIHRQAAVADPQHPAVLFHVTTAYNILRHAGVDLAKKDFLGPPR